MIGLRYRRNSIWQTSCFSTREKVAGIHLLRPSSHTHSWLSLTDCSQGGGACDSCALHCTQLTLTDWLLAGGGGGACDSCALHCTQLTLTDWQLAGGGGGGGRVTRALFTAHSWLSLTDCSQGGGACDSCALHCTQLTLTDWLTARGGGGVWLVRSSLHTADSHWLTARRGGGGGGVWLVRSSLHTADSHWLTARRGGGGGRVTRALFTAHSGWNPALSIFDDTEKNCTYHRNGIAKHFSGFETVTFPNRGIPCNRLSAHA